jgi:hypothetical protein
VGRIVGGREPALSRNRLTATRKVARRRGPDRPAP